MLVNSMHSPVDKLAMADRRVPWYSKELSYGQRELFKRRARQAGSLGPDLAKLSVTCAVTVTVYALFPIPLRGFMFGLLAGMVPIGLYMVLITRSYAQTMGIWAEDRTGDALSKLGWPSVRNLNFEHCDVDAVAATPSRLWAIETKWRMGTRNSAVSQRRHSDDLVQAARMAGKVRSLMRSSPTRLEVPVAAVLLLWGECLADVSFGYDAGAEVYVLDGNKLWDWPRELTAGLPDPRVELAFAKAQAYAHEHADRITYKGLAVLLAGEFKNGWQGRERKSRHGAKASAA